MAREKEHGESAHRWHERDNRHGGHTGEIDAPKHDSIKKYEHEGHEHSSEDR